MEWSDDYATGVQRIDDQHKRIFKTADDYRIAFDEGKGEASYGVLLDFLERYCRSHFGFEERCMEEHRCPVAQQNKEAHAAFLAVVREFLQRYESSGYRPADALELLDTVDQWLHDHICRIDIHLRDCVRK